METFAEEFAKAHDELMKATGWDLLLSNMTYAMNNAPDMLSAVWEEVQHIYHTIDWSEPFFTYLAVAHLLIFTFAMYFTRGNVSEEFLFGSSIMFLVFGFGSMLLNATAGDHAAYFFRRPGQNYFDDAGLFMAIFVWFPLVLIALILQMRLLFRVLSLMLLVKKQRKAHAARRDAAQQQQDAAPDADAHDEENHSSNTQGAEEMEDLHAKKEN